MVQQIMQLPIAVKWMPMGVEYLNMLMWMAILIITIVLVTA